MVDEPNNPRDLSELDARIRAARDGDRSNRRVPGIGRTESLSGLGGALRIGAELVSALIVGVGIGYFLDRWLGTGPWLLVLFFFLGSAAGFVNVFRAVTEFGKAPKDETKKTEPGANQD